MSKSGGCIQASPSPNLFNRNLRAYSSRTQRLPPRRISRMGKTVFPAKGRCHVMRSCHVVENSIGGSLPPRMRGLETRPLPNANGKIPTVLDPSCRRGQGCMDGAASDSSMRTTIVDPTSKPTAQELLPRLIGFPLDTQALLHDMWQLFLAVQLIPVSAAAFACEIKSTLSSLGKLGRTGWWTVDRGPWMRG